MTTRSIGQSWALDAAIAQGGFDALHPRARGIIEELGVYHTDFDAIFDQVRSGAMLPKAWSSTAARNETRAHHYLRDGFVRTAADFYRRAALLWAHAQYTIADPADTRKAAFREHVNACVEQYARLREGRVRRVVLDFAGRHLYGLLHLPDGEVRDAPAVILGPGMDMIKEDYLLVAQRYYTTHGMVALSIDGPGQGESRVDGVPVGLTNPEQALSAFLDHLAALPEVDAARIGMFGISMSGYWGHRLAATDHRLAALASFEGVTGDFATIFERAQPSFKANFMSMAGYTDEAAFDRELAAHLPLGELVDAIGCPVLVGVGEFDELSRLDQVIATYERMSAPKELRVYENEFHPLGGVAAEALRFGADWLARALAGELAQPGRDARYYLHTDGRVTEGSADPTWWLGGRPA